MATIYRFLDTGIQDAALNMAIDEAIQLRHLEGQAPPTLRVFRWTQPSISLGRFQQVEREVLLEQCEQRGIALVRRPTGGRAVYHRDEFTYSFVSSRNYGIPAGVVASYAYLAQGLIAALNSMGVSAELSEGRVSKNPSAACFASSTQADLTSSGFKIIGSAQVWKEDVLLQQGSLPLDDRSSEFYSLLRFADEVVRSEALAEYREKTTPLRTFAPLISWEEVARAFRVGFGAALQVDFQVSELTPEEWELAHQLAAEKYSKLSWLAERVKFLD